MNEKAWNDGYAYGFSEGDTYAQDCFRLQAFAAIRRAAAVARAKDRFSQEIISDSPALAMASDIAADNVREAIRAAIGSDKTT